MENEAKMESISNQNQSKNDTQNNAKKKTPWRGGGSRFRTSINGGFFGGALIRVMRRQGMPYHAKPSQPGERRGAIARRGAARSRAGTKGEGEGEGRAPSHADPRKRGGG